MRRRVVLAAALAVTAALGLRLGCGAGASVPVRAVSVILVSVDSLRSDHLGSYGHRPSVTPAMDAFARDAVLFRWAIAQGSSTLVSHASMFTSLIPQHHGASLAWQTPLADDRLTLAEAVRAAGFRTPAFHGGGQLDAAFGVGQGFQRYQVEAGPFANAVDQALGWLGRRHPERFFLFLHTYAAHHPYTLSPEDAAALDSDYDGPLPREISIELLARVNANKPKSITEADLRHIERAYDSGVRRVDAGFGALLDGLERLGLYDSTLVILTSDHGEEFGEHGMVGMHGHTLYDELLHVPLLVKYPRSWRGGSTVHAQVRTIDIAPTVLATLGLPVPAAFEGQDLTDCTAAGRCPPPYAVSAIDGGRSSLRSPEWKLDGGRLYDLRDDPGELVDVAAKHTGRADDLQRTEQEIVTATTSGADDRMSIDPSLQEHLKSLGYAQ